MVVEEIAIVKLIIKYATVSSVHANIPANPTNKNQLQNLS